MRDTRIVIGVILVVAVIGILFSLRWNFLDTASSVVDTNQTSAVSVLFRELAHGQNSTVTTRTNYIITSSGQLSQLWKMIDAKGRQTPVVDFTKNDVIAIFAGNKPTVGYTIAISKIEDTQTRIVDISLTKPGISCASAESIISPYQIIEVPKATTPLTHKDEVTTISCLQ